MFVMLVSLFALLWQLPILVSKHSDYHSYFTIIYLHNKFRRNPDKQSYNIFSTAGLLLIHLSGFRLMYSDIFIYKLNGIHTCIKTKYQIDI